MKAKSILIILNSVLIPLTLLSLTLNFISLSAYSISLSGIYHDIQYEDVPMKVFTSFSVFSTSACDSSQDELILSLCTSLPLLQLSGTSFIIITYTSLAVSLLSLYRSFTHFPSTFTVVLPALLYLAGSLVYFTLVRLAENKEKGQKLDFSYEVGCFIVVCINFVQGLLVARHFYYGKLRNESFFKLQEPESFSNTGEVLIGKIGKGQENEDVSGSRRNEVWVKELEKKNTMLVEKLKINGDTNWDVLNAVKNTLDVLAGSVEMRNFDSELSVIIGMKNDLKVFLDELQIKKTQEWEVEKKFYENTVASLKSELSTINSPKNNEILNMRNQIFTLEAERNQLISSLEKASTELKRLQDLAERSVSMSNFQSTNSEIIRLNQELKKAQKSLQDKSDELAQSENVIKSLKNSESKYKECLNCMGKLIKEDFLPTNASGEFDANMLSEQVANYSDILQKSKHDLSLLESKVSELEWLNQNLSSTLAESEKKYNELKDLPGQIKELVEKEASYKEYLQDLNNKYVEMKKEKRGLEKELKQIRKQYE